MLDFSKIISPTFLSFPVYKYEDGKYYKLDHFEETESGFTPVYIETDEVDDAEAFNIIFGGEE